MKIKQSMMLIRSGLIHEIEKCTTSLKLIKKIDKTSDLIAYQFNPQPKNRTKSITYFVLNHFVDLALLVLNLIFHVHLKMFEVVVNILSSAPFYGCIATHILLKILATI